MPMTNKGLSKLAEEIGELQVELGKLQQTIGKLLGCPDTDLHWDGGPPLTQRLQEEMADVTAAMQFVFTKHHCNSGVIISRIKEKLALYQQWDGETGT